MRQWIYDIASTLVIWCIFYPIFASLEMWPRSRAPETFLSLNILEESGFRSNLFNYSCSQQDWKQDRKVIAHIWKSQIFSSLGNVPIGGFFTFCSSTNNFTRNATVISILCNYNFHFENWVKSVFLGQVENFMSHPLVDQISKIASPNKAGFAKYPISKYPTSKWIWQ